jgi:hypothetical protein
MCPTSSSSTSSSFPISPSTDASENNSPAPLPLLDSSLLSNFLPSDKEKAECEIFQLMLELISKTGKLQFSGLWGERVPKLKLRVYQLDR